MKKRDTVLPRPVTFNRIAAKADAYLADNLFYDHATLALATQTWSVGGRIVSFKVSSGGIIKRLGAFYAHQTEEQFLALIQECQSVGIVRPSSYADIFNQRWHTPRIPYSMNALMEPGFFGGWQEAIRTGLINKPLNRYDMNSAYLWAASEGLPDTDTLSFTDRWRGDVLGAVYLLHRSEHRDRIVPYPFNHKTITWCLATQEEMKAYELPKWDVVAGITWQRLNHESIAADILALPAANHVRKCFWGRWASLGTLECSAMRTGTQWPVRNPVLNLVWAHFIISRVKQRLWTNLCHASGVHVFVDSIITETPLPVGDGIGHFKLEKHYPNGLVIHGPGIYGEPGAQLDKHAGIQQGRNPYVATQGR